MKYFSLLFLLILQLVVGCHRHETSENVSLRLIREIAIQVDDSDDFIGQVFDLALDEHGLFYLADRLNHAVVIVDSSGKIVKKIGSYGSGPGELISPVSIVCSQDTLYVLESGSSRISIFDHRGKFVRSVFVPGSRYLSGVEVNPKMKRVVVSESLGMEHFKFYSLNGRPLSPKKKNYDIAAVIQPILLPGGHMTSWGNDAILYSPIRSYEVLKLNWMGDTLATYTANPKSYVKPALDSREKYINQTERSFITLPLVSGDYVLIQRITLFPKQKNKERKRYIDVFSHSGEPIQLGIPVKYSFYAVDENYLYGINMGKQEEQDTGPSIVVYKIE